MNLFGSCMEKNSDRALLLFGDWRKSLFFSPAPLTPLRRLAPPVQGRWEWRLGEGGAEWGDCLGILLRRERARSLCSGVSPTPLAFRRPGVPCFGGAGERGTSGPWPSCLIPHALCGKGSNFLLQEWKLRLKGVRHLARVSQRPFSISSARGVRGGVQLKVRGALGCPRLPAPP